MVIMASRGQQHPYSSSRMWQLPAFRRVLATSDCLANVTTLLIIVVGIFRLHALLPTDQAAKGIYFGPKSPMFSMLNIFSLYGISSTAALLMLVCKPNTYFKHRGPICLAQRLLRLAVQIAAMVTPSTVAPLAVAIMARVMDNPQKSARILFLQPMMYYMQHALILLQLREVVVIQLASVAGMLYWLWQSPCHMQHLHPELNTHAWREHAEQACSILQSCAAFLGGAVGRTLSELSAQACQGGAGMQTLQIFGVWVSLFVGPVLLTYELERWMRRSAVQHRSRQDHGQHTDTTSPSAGSSSSRRGRFDPPIASSSSSVLRSEQVPSVDSLSSSRLLELADAGAEAGLPWGHAGMVLLVLVLVLPVLWLVSEATAMLFEARRDCAAILSAVVQ